VLPKSGVPTSVPERFGGPARLTQAAVARSLGVNRESVARWEAGTRHPRGEVLRRYAALLEELERVAGK
jgi:DNA-binding XRE family transcriptional regulator